MEAAVIVASILLAFWIDASWEARTDRIAERELIHALRGDLVATGESLDGVIGVVDRRIDAFVQFYGSTPREMASLSEDSAQVLAQWLTGSLTFNPRDGALYTSNLADLTNTEHRASLGAWMQAASDLAEDSPFIIEMSLGIQRTLFEISEEVFADQTLNGSTAAALEAMRADPDYVRERYMLSQLHRINRRKLTQLAEATRGAIAQLERARN